MIIQALITALFVALTAPLLTMLLLGRRPVNPFALKKVSPTFSAEAFIAALKRNQADIEEIRPADADHETVVIFRYQGGNFVAFHTADAESRLCNSVSISFFNCFETGLENLAILESVVNDLAAHTTPIKATIKQSENADKLEVSLHASGLRISDTPEDAEFLHSLLTGYFEVRRILAAEFEKTAADKPNTLIQNVMPRAHAAYVMARSEIEQNFDKWGGPWWETPQLTLSNVLDRLTGSMPSDSAKIVVNGRQVDEKASEFLPFGLMIKSNLQDDEPVLSDYMTIDIIEPDEYMYRNVHLIVRLTSVEERLITLHLYAMQSGLPVSAFRPIGSPETLPRAFSSALGLHRGGSEMFKAEAEYMAQEQGLLDILKNGDAAYSIYWGQTLFTSDRFFEAAHYFQNAYDIIAPTMGNPQEEPEAKLELFFDICFFLGQTYYKLGRYRDSYYYLDIIVNQHRVRWTEQYILTLVALRDPRLDSMLSGLRAQLVDQTNEGEETAHITALIDFIDRQMILVTIQQGKIDEARLALEKRLEDTPDDVFALHWLAKLG